MASAAEILARKKPVEIPHSVVLDPAAERELFDAAQAHLAAAEALKADPSDQELQGALVTAEAAVKAAGERVEAATHVFLFRALPPGEYKALLAAFPATKAQKKEFRDLGGQGLLQWNSEEFPPALIAACCVDPELTVEQANEIWTGGAWNSYELDNLFSAALIANTTSGIVTANDVEDAGKASTETQDL